MSAGIVLKHLMFTGPAVPPARIDFSDALNLLYGASNTGKSFALKALDFALGGSKGLPEISERDGYDRVWLALTAGNEEVTLARALAGGNFQLWPGHVLDAVEDTLPRPLGAKHEAGSDDNVSRFLLAAIDLTDKVIAVDANGKKRSLSFRDLARFSLVDETTIQSEEAPLQSGQTMFATAERSVFKLLLTGVDDSAIVEVIDRKTFKTSTAAKIEMLDDMLLAVQTELDNTFPDSEALAEQEKRLEKTFAAVQADVEAARSPASGAYFKDRANESEALERAKARLGEVEHNLARFAQLDEIYRSDVERLKALEEWDSCWASMAIVTVPCEASPTRSAGASTHRRHRRSARGFADRDREDQPAAQRLAARPVTELNAEAARLQESLSKIGARLAAAELALARLTPQATEVRRKLSEITEVRDLVKRGRSLVDQRMSLQHRKAELEALRPAGKADKPKLGVGGTVAHDFAQTVSQVLRAWHFPGDLHVSFDDTVYDLRIDGKLRRDNGKGVRAITHAAFKVALLIFCHERRLPHPGFLVLDTPLLTYRDPMDRKAGELAEDERRLAQTSLKQHFFDHLGHAWRHRTIHRHREYRPTGRHREHRHRRNLPWFCWQRSKGLVCCVTIYQVALLYKRTHRCVSASKWDPES